MNNTLNKPPFTFNYKGENKDDYPSVLNRNIESQMDSSHEEEDTFSTELNNNHIFIDSTDTLLINSNSKHIISDSNSQDDDDSLQIPPSSILFKQCPFLKTLSQSHCGSLGTDQTVTTPPSISEEPSSKRKRMFPIHSIASTLHSDTFPLTHRLRISEKHHKPKCLSTSGDRTGSTSLFFHKSRKSMDSNDLSSHDLIGIANDQLTSYFNFSDLPIIQTTENIATPSKTYINSFSNWCNLVNSHPIVDIDVWSTLITPTEQYTNENSQKLVKISNNFVAETGPTSVTNNSTLKEFNIINRDNDFPYYREFFYNNSSVKHYIDTSNKQIISCIKDKSIYLKATVLNTNGIVRCIIPSTFSTKKCFTILKNSNSIVKLANKQRLDDSLLKIYQEQIISKYKFGVVYVGKGQNNENDIFSNTECSPAFWKFMNLIGNRVQLQGYNGYSGGLDTKLNCTGKESYSTTYESYDCMFHVSPLIPTKKDDLQSLERKRFVGNDVVVLVFKEQNDRDDVFDPSIIHSQFNHVWIIVSPHKTDETNKSYTINVISKCEVLPFPPFLSPSKQLPILPICLHNQDTKEFILKKLINAERSALNTESFLTKSKRVLSYQIDSLINNFV